MDETLIVPSPNWFQVSGLAISRDGWVVYGGPSKSLCVLEPLPIDYDGVIMGSQKYHAHMINRAHIEKIVSVDISPEWPEKRLVLTGSADGAVRQWNLKQLQESHKIKPSHSHEIHSREKEEIAGVGYSNETYAITVGCYGNIVKWNLNSNVISTFNHLRNFKPVCMSCSPHISLNVAVGTKQGVVFVLDLNGTGKVIYKVRGQDDEIVNLSWCPVYELALKKALQESEKRGSTTLQETEKKGSTSLQETEKRGSTTLKETEKNSSATLQETEKRGSTTLQETEKRGSTNLQETEKKGSTTLQETEKKGSNILQETEKRGSTTLQETENRCSTSKTNQAVVKNKEDLNDSGRGRNLPEDSFDDSLVEVQEDDMFDIYKDHEADEFGHKKYQPEDILVKVHQDETKQDDYLAECLKLKEEIMKRKTESDMSIQTLVDALDKTHVDSPNSEIPTVSSSSNVTESEAKDNNTKNQGEEASEHIHKHLLATISKYGGVRIWSKSGKLVGSCVVPTANNKQPKNKNPFWPTLLWYKAGVLLLADGKNNLVECNPLKLDCKNKLDWKVVHSIHKRAIYSIASNAPRLQTGNEASNDWHIWTTSQERTIVQYSLTRRRKVAIHPTCGGFIYTVLPCPYDASKVAISAGDGAIRVLTANTSAEDETKLQDVQVTCYWQNVLGKVLVAAWHPTKENLLAFATAESRVGLVDTGGQVERAARTLVPALRGAVYSVAWGGAAELYACAAGELVLYNTDRVHEPPTAVEVCVEGQKWEVSCVRYSARALLVGSNAGAVAALTARRPHRLLAATHLYSKMIYMVEWHPQQTSNSSEESPYKNLIAVCSMDKQNTIVILEYIEKEDGSIQLQTWKTLSGYKLPVFQVSWNPHHDGQLLATSQDHTVRVWDIATGACTCIFAGHSASSLGAAWSAFPALGARAMSGGSDCCLRVWATGAHPPLLYDADKQEVAPKKKKGKKSKEKKEIKEEADTEETVAEETDDIVAATLENKLKVPKKFLLPTLYKQTASFCKVVGVRILLQKHLEKTMPDKLTDLTICSEQSVDLDYVKMFGTINEVNDLLDMEESRHDEKGNMEPLAILCMFRGQVERMVQLATQRDMLCPFLLSLAPCVSFKYWKDATQLYVAQIDRLVAKGEEEKLYVNKMYGGPIYRKVATLLSVHDVKGAVAVLTAADLYKEAYILCRTRYMDSIATQTLQQWAEYCSKTGTFVMAAACYIALGDLSQAAATLGKLNDEEALQLAADIAKLGGQNMLADHICGKRDNIKNNTDASNKTEEILKELPSRIEALMSNGDKKENGKTIYDEKTVINGSGDAKE